MKVICRQADLFQTVICEQKPRENEEYTWSKFAVRLNTANGRLAYNNLTKELVLIENYEVEKELLIKKRFLVPTSFDEFGFNEEVRKLAKLLVSSEKGTGISSAVILTTSLCNARCCYCYEAGCHEMTMSEKTAEDVAAFLASNCSRGKELKLCWFGGEPLLNPDVIDTICSRLAEAGVKFNSRTITNASLMSDSLISNALTRWNLKQTQITLDGTEEKYNEIKNYADGKSHFAEVLNNTEKLLKSGIKVKIRLNFTGENYDDLLNLMNLLSERFTAYKGRLLTCYVSMIYQLNGSEGALEDELNRKYHDIRRAILDAGLSKPAKLERKVKANRCMADSEHSVVILPDGSLNSCEHFNEITEPWGSIYSEEKDAEVYKSWFEYKPLEENCRNCFYLPSCMTPKNCPGAENSCKKWYREEVLERTKEAMLNEYNTFKKKQ